MTTAKVFAIPAADHRCQFRSRCLRTHAAWTKARVANDTRKSQRAGASIGVWLHTRVIPNSLRKFPSQFREQPGSFAAVRHLRAILAQPIRRNMDSVLRRGSSR